MVRIGKTSEMANKIFRSGKGSLTSSVLNIVGMAMAFAAMYLILVQIVHDLGYNRKIKDSERIYVLALPDWYDESRYMTYTARPFWEDIITSLPCVESGGCCWCIQEETDFYTDEAGSNKIVLNKSRVSSGFIGTFGFEASEGSFGKSLGDNEIAISESNAKKFGLGAGSTLYWKDSDGNMSHVSVAAVFKDMPSNSDLYQFGSIVNLGDECRWNYNEWSYIYFVKLRSPQDKEEFERLAFERIRDEIYKDGAGNGNYRSYEDMDETLSKMTCRLFPIEDLYFSRNVTSTIGKSGNRTTTLSLLAIAILVLAITFINFINFFFALVPVRLKSVNTRKILGASRSSLVAATVMESVVMVTASLVLAGVLVKMFSGSTLASLISSGTSLPDNLPIAAATVSLALVLSVITSIYPALYLTSFFPAFALKGSFGSVSKGKAFRTGLIGFQFVTSISLIICASFISMQRSYMLHYDMGFNKSRLLEVTTTWRVSEARKECTSMLKSNPAIKDVTWASGSIVAPMRMGWGREFKGEQINFQCYPVSWDFLRFMGIDIVEGRDFTEADESSEKGVYIFNEAARDKFRLTLEDKMSGHQGDTEIAGFCKNFNYKSLESEVQPFALYIFGKNNWKSYSTLYVRTAENADIPAVFSHIRSVFHEIDPSVEEDEIDVRFFDSRLDSQYAKEKSTSRIILLFTALAIMISLMGVFGLVMFDAEHRRKEIGIRRVNGAGIGEVLAMFNMKFIKIVLVCFAIAAPLSYFVTDAYLKGFAYRMPVYWWVLALALAAVLAVTCAVVTLRSLSAVLSDPVDALRNE